MIATITLFACGATSAAARSDGLAVDALPEAVRADYAVFAQRCSKCHSLARPLGADVTDDRFWARYVARMRRMPGSGISTEDAEVILRFLHWYAGEQRRPRADAGGG